jgi:potassium-transporting ATPase KdpC subunit
MVKQLIISLRMTIVTLIIVSGIYPLIVWGIAQAAFRHQANGSLVKNSAGQIVGSELLGQSFAKPEYFQSRPSAAGNGYDPTESGGTNLGPTSDKLINGIHKLNLKNGQPDPTDFDGVKDLAVAYRMTNGLPTNAPVPVDAVTRSASGLDPDISTFNAAVQAPRVAKARGVDPAVVQALVQKYTKGRDLGFIGEPRVNVLQINLALDAEYPPHK